MFGIGTGEPRSPQDAIVSYYRNLRRVQHKSLRPITHHSLSTVCTGLGDTMMLTDFPKACAQQGKQFGSFSPSQHFRPLMKFNPFWRDTEDKAYLVNAPDLVRQYDCGNGHYLQRIRRAFGLEIDDVPRGSITWKGTRMNKRVILHFDAGIHANWQRLKIHPRARILYDENRKALEQFIAAKPDFEFVQIGKNKLPIKGAKNVHTETTTEIVETIAAAGWFIGIMSGPMHVATALGLKCVVVVNFPSAKSIFLPTLIATDAVESEWMYPQNVHLHQDDEGELVKRYSLENLRRAFDGEIYPFWKTDCCALIHEKL